MRLELINFSVAAVIGLALIRPALASPNLRWLQYSPVGFFTDQDWNFLKDSAKDGETIEWSNPASNRHGSVTPLSTRQSSDRTCRDLKIVNHANGR